MPKFPDDWERHRLGELGTYVNGMAFKPSDWADQGLPIIRIQNLTDSRKPFNHYAGTVKQRYLVHDGDLLISWSASLGAFIWSGERAILNQHIFRVAVNEELVLKEFLYFLVLRMLEEMKEHTHGSTMKHITKKKFDALPVAVPPLPEQRRFVARLAECLERVAEIASLRVASALEARALVNAIRHDAWMRLRDKYGTCELREYAADTRNGLYKPRKFHGDGAALYRMFNINRGFVDRERVERLRVSADELGKYSLVPGDILVSRVNSRELVGKSAMVREVPEPAVFEAMLIRLRLRAGHEPFVVAQLMNAPAFLHDLRGRAKHAIGQSSINQEDLLTTLVPHIPASAQALLIGKLEETIRSARDVAAESATIREHDHLKMAVIRRAFEGGF